MKTSTIKSPRGLRNAIREQEAFFNARLFLANDWDDTDEVMDRFSAPYISPRGCAGHQLRNGGDE